MKKLLVRIVLAGLLLLPPAAILLNEYAIQAQTELKYPVLVETDTQYFMSTFPTGLRYSEGWFGTFTQCPPVDEILLFDDDKGICIFRTKPGLTPKGEQGGTTLKKIPIDEARKIVESYPLEVSVKPIDPEVKEIMPHDAYFMGVWSGEKLKEKFNQTQAEIKTEIDVTGKEIQTVNGKELTTKQKTALQLYDTAIANKAPFDLAKYDPNRYFVMGQMYITDGTATVAEAGRIVADCTLNITDPGGGGNFTLYMANGTTGTLTSGTCTITGSVVTLAAGANVITIAGTGTATLDITIGTTANWFSVNSWSAASGSYCTASVPTSADATFFDANSFTAGSQTTTANGAQSFSASFDFTGATNTPAFTANDEVHTGAITLISAMTWNCSYRLYYGDTITSAGKNLCSGGYTYGTDLTLADDMTNTATTFWFRGTFTTNNYTVTIGNFISDTNSINLAIGTSVFNCTDFNLYYANAYGITVSGNHSIRITGTGGFTGYGKTYYELQFNGSSHTISGNNTFTNLILKADTTQTITFTDGSTQTVTTPTITGSAGKVKTLQGSGAAGWAITKAGGGTVTASYMSISRSTGNPANTWYVTDGTSTNGGNNSGWVWPVTPTLTTEAADDITSTSVTLNGTIVTAVPDSTIRGFEYDTNTGAPYASDYHEHGSYAAGAYDYALTPLNQGTEYFSRAYATNPAGTGYGSEAKFLTLPDPPTGFTITQLDLALKLDWTAGAGAGTTYIRGKIGGYPANSGDGTLVYNSTGITFTHAPLVYGDAWYYRAWSYTAIDGLSQYSATYAQAFETAEGLPLAPTVFTMTQTNLDEATGTWITGVSASTTVIRWNTSAYPDTVTDGFEAYNGAAETFVKNELDFDRYGYYWRAWSENPTGYSLTYAEGTLGGNNMEALADAVVGFNAIIAGLAILVFINAMAIFGGRSIFLKALACPVDIGIGLAYATTPTANSLWISGAAIAVVGLYWLFVAVTMGWELHKVK